MKRPEQALHKSIAAYLGASLPKPWIFWHTPNGGGRSKVEAAIFKAMGVRAGIPDLFVLGPERFLVGLECKSEKGRLSPAQKEALGALAELGVPTIVCRDLDDAIAALASLGVPLRGRVL